MFATGLRRSPPLGFSQQPSIKFLYKNHEFLPTANTCEMSLSLPTVHQNYKEFQRFLVWGFREGMVFGFE